MKKILCLLVFALTCSLQLDAQLIKLGKKKKAEEEAKPAEKKKEGKMRGRRKGRG